MKLTWRKICEWRWESELTLAGGYAIDRQPGSASLTVLKLKPRASTKEQMRWESVGGAWTLPDAKRMALHDADGTTQRFMEKARAERAAAKMKVGAPVSLRWTARDEQRDDGKVVDVTMRRGKVVGIAVEFPDDPGEPYTYERAADGLWVELNNSTDPVKITVVASGS